MKKHHAYIMISLSYILGRGSLLMFCAFCYFGSFHLMKLEFNTYETLLLDAGLSLFFFLQHSGMVRKSFCRYLTRTVPEAYIGSIYAISSAIVLFIVLIFWQETSITVATADGAFRFVLRMLFAASIAGFYWGIRSLDLFDAFGIRSIVTNLHNKKQKEIPFIIRGPYRWVRHPLYLCVLIMIWSNPDLTADRLLFNIFWTIWIFIGTVLEERDLISHFGEEYRQYQEKVPMLIPLRFFPSWPK